MKVLLYTHEFPPFQGGLATTSYKLAKGFAKAGIDTTVLAPGYSEEDAAADGDSDFAVRRMSAFTRNHGAPSPVKEIAGWISLSRYLSSNTPDAVLLVTREAHFAGGISPLDPRKYRIIARVAGREAKKFLLGQRFKNRVQARFMNRLYRRAHKIIGPSESTRQMFIESGIPGERVGVIHNGTPRELILREADPAAVRRLREKYGIEPSEKMILTVSRLTRGKGQDKVIEALSAVREKYTNFRYVIAGEGRYEKALRDLVASKRLGDRVVFAGSVRHEDVWIFYDACDIFAMVNRTIPSEENIEGLPNVLIEAAARGKPIVTGVDGGGKEAVEQGRSGYVTDGNNVPRIAQYLVELLSDEDKSREFGARGKQKMLEDFTEEGMIDKYLGVIGYRA
ncbi:MAG: glycosyltransferase family 4 protein [Candidatus Dadabacteria bacterium]|nr:glycosyltransferase family 4 protein [Candidatus Dadabacteria bacterium]MYB27055.1 glycosyltransferase family 4 protein [Candidatus Dadabacteria bacterium]